MLLRTTVLLLLLCVSASKCASLASFQSQETETENETLADAAVEDAAPAEDQAGDAPATEEPVADELVSDTVPVEDPTDDQQAPAVDAAPAEEAEEDSDGPPPDTQEVLPTPEEEDNDGPPADTLEVPPTPAEEVNDTKPAETQPSPDHPVVTTQSSTWGLSTIRNSFQSVHGYFDSLVELVGGRNGVCQYKCRYGDAPEPRPGYHHPEPNGCSSSLVGLQLDLGIPAMTQCCNQLDVCYDTCGAVKSDCDGNFRQCLLGICSDLKKSLGFVSQVQACDSVADVLHNTVWTLGCRPYMNSQRAACVCHGEEKDEL